MPTPVIGVDGFEDKFRKTIDPWNYSASAFEAHKRTVLLHACGPSIHGRALELVSAIGETTRFLAPHCLRLLATDGAPSAVAEARRRTERLARVEVRHAVLPDQFPRGPFDLVVVSELLYYLDERNAARLTLAMIDRVAPSGRLVLLHHHPWFNDAAHEGERAQAIAAQRLRRHFRLVSKHRQKSFTCLAMHRRRS